MAGTPRWNSLHPNDNGSQPRAPRRGTRYDGMQPIFPEYQSPRSHHQFPEPRSHLYEGLHREAPVHQNFFSFKVSPRARGPVLSFHNYAPPASAPAPIYEDPHTMSRCPRGSTNAGRPPNPPAHPTPSSPAIPSSKNENERSRPRKKLRFVWRRDNHTGPPPASRTRWTDILSGRGPPIYVSDRTWFPQPNNASNRHGRTDSTTAESCRSIKGANNGESRPHRRQIVMAEQRPPPDIIEYVEEYLEGDNDDDPNHFWDTYSSYGSSSYHQNHRSRGGSFSRY